MLSAQQSFRRSPLSHILAAGSHVRVLRELCLHGGPVAPKQILEATKLSDKGLRLALAALVQTGIVRGLGMRQGQLFEVATDHVLSQPLRALFATERKAWEETIEQLRTGLQASDAIRAAWMYGSVARGDDRPGSDTDLAILAEDDAPGTADNAREDTTLIAEKLNLGASVIVISPHGLATGAVQNDWFSSVVHQAKTLKGKDPLREKARCKRDLEKK